MVPPEAFSTALPPEQTESEVGVIVATGAEVAFTAMEIVSLQVLASVTVTI